MLQKLVDRVHCDDIIEADGKIVAFERASDTVTLDIQIFDAESGAPVEVWRVRCAGFKEFCIRPEQGDIATFNSTHAAVRQYVERGAEIFFVGAAAEPGQVAERLRAAHNRLAGDWIPFERYVNRIPLANLLGRAGGRIFAGPQFLAREFLRVLQDSGVTTSHLPEDIGEQPLPTSSLEMLVVGSSHIIGEDFDAAKVSAGAVAPGVEPDGPSARGLTPGR